MSEEQEDNVIPLRSTLRDMLENPRAAADHDISIPGDEQEKLKRFNKEYAWVESYFGEARLVFQVPGEVKGTFRFESISEKSFLSTYQNQTMVVDPSKGTLVELGKWWMKHADRRTYKRVEFNPDLLIKDSYGAFVVGKNLNLYTGFGVEATKGSWRRMIRHIHRVLCKGQKDRFKYTMRWLAWAVQNPGKRAEVCIVWQGEKGAGKGFLANTLVDIFGSHGQQISNREHLTGKFNNHLETCCFLAADEAYYPGDKDIEGVLKSIITEPQIQIEGKFQTTRKSRNCLKIMMCSNNKWVIQATPGERRFFIAEVSDAYTNNGKLAHKKQEYFRALRAELDSGGKEAMLYHLLNMNLNGWHPRDEIPHTAELDAQIFEGLTIAEKLAYELLESGVLPGANRQAKWTSILEYMQKLNPQSTKVSPRKFSQTLRIIGATTIHTSKGNVWIFPPLKEAREEFERKLAKTPVPFELGPNGEDDWMYTNVGSEF